MWGFLPPSQPSPLPSASIPPRVQTQKEKEKGRKVKSLHDSQGSQLSPAFLLLLLLLPINPNFSTFRIITPFRLSPSFASIKFLPFFSMALNLTPQLNPLASSSSSVPDATSSPAPVSASYAPSLSSIRIRSDSDALSPPLTPTSRSPSLFSSTRPDLSSTYQAFAPAAADPVVVEHRQGGLSFGGTVGGGFGGVPVYVMMPLDSVRGHGKGVNRKKAMAASMRALRSAGVEGIMVDVWWGLVEKDEDGRYEWGGYEELLDMAAKNGLKVQAVMSFHQCGGNVGDSCSDVVSSFP